MHLVKCNYIVMTNGVAGMDIALVLERDKQIQRLNKHLRGANSSRTYCCIARSKTLLGYWFTPLFREILKSV